MITCYPFRTAHKETVRLGGGITEDKRIDAGDGGARPQMP